MMRLYEYEGCERKHAAKGYCKSHYNQLRKDGFVTTLLPHRVTIAPRADEPCASRVCEEQSTRDTDLCHKHRQEDSRLRTKYGVTLLEREAAEGDCCPLCGSQPGKLHLDHDHKTGEKRGYLCGSCNRALGLMKDDPEVLRAAADYLEKHLANTGRMI